jgi:hypothetical protein
MPFDGQEFGSDNRPLHKLDKVVDLLRTDDQWCKNELKSSDGTRRCLLGALIEVGARISLRKHILDAAHEITGNSYQRIESFNDDTATDHHLVVAVLGRARENILLGRKAPPRSISVARRVRTFYSALARLAA